MNENNISGSCLCGEVTYEFSGLTKVFQYCHCSRCQKITGSAHASNIIIDPNEFNWSTGEGNIGRFELAEAKHFASSFCKTCGSSLPWLTQSGKAVIIPAGTLDQDPGVKPQHNIYYADKASWYMNADDLIKYDALPIKN